VLDRDPVYLPLEDAVHPETHALDHLDKEVGAENLVMSRDLHAFVYEAPGGLVVVGELSRRGLGECGHLAGADRAIGAGGECCSA
jgi:hypothetical protein